MAPPRAIYFSGIVASLRRMKACIDEFQKIILKDSGGQQAKQTTAFDLAAFWLSMITPVKKSVNHSKTVASMRRTD